MDCVEAPSFAILINGALTDFFYLTSGLHQGCPLSPYLFILCADALSCTLWMVVQRAELEPYWPASRSQPLSHLLFADDCLLLGHTSIWNVRGFVSVVKVKALYLPCFGLAGESPEVINCVHPKDQEPGEAGD